MYIYTSRQLHKREISTLIYIYFKCDRIVEHARIGHYFAISDIFNRDQDLLHQRELNHTQRRHYKAHSGIRDRETRIMLNSIRESGDQERVESVYQIVAIESLH